jgi:sterol desaturase/sphingolipid hydroxylase (fatty acid hydroxylase superfamily)
LHKAHHSAEVLTPLVNFRVHPLDSLILADNLALIIGVIGGFAQYALGREAVSFTLFDQNVLMLIYIYVTAQLQHSEIWIPFTGVWGRVFMSPAHHQLHHSADPAHSTATWGQAWRSGIGSRAVCACLPLSRPASPLASRDTDTTRTA